MGVSKHNYLTVSVHFSLENHFPMIKHRYRKAHYKNIVTVTDITWLTILEVLL